MNYIILIQFSGPIYYMKMVKFSPASLIMKQKYVQTLTAGVGHFCGSWVRKRDLEDTSPIPLEELRHPTTKLKNLWCWDWICCRPSDLIPPFCSHIQSHLSGGLVFSFQFQSQEI